MVLVSGCSTVAGTPDLAVQAPVSASAVAPVDALLVFGERADSFRAVDDRVMGGVSQSGMSVTRAGHALFSGNLSLENNGGFASVRASGLALDVSAHERLVLRVRGDGKRYKVRLHDDARFDGVAFEAVFDTVSGEWMEVELPLDGFRPVWRGRPVPSAPPLERRQVVMLGFMISGAQAGSFALELDWLAGR